MWVNKCIWDHGFLFFGDEYPKEKNATFTEQLGAFIIIHISVFVDQLMHICAYQKETLIQGAFGN